jgi:arabinan endo-1,5-alpha-L-arabinosidase
VFTNPPSWTTNTVHGFHGHFWAPDIIRLGDQYLLYYAISVFGRNTSAIGLATNPTLDPESPRYRWSDAGLVIESHTNDTFNTIDPAVTRDTAGRLWLAFGSFWSGIKLIELDPATGKRISRDSPMYSLAHNSTIEASYIYPHDGHYYLFVNWGICCRGTNSTYEIRVGRSEQISGPYLDRAGKDMMDRGGTLLLQSDGPFIGPGHAGIVAENGRYWFSCHFYDGLQHGRQTLAVRPLKWGIDGWPQIETEN